jgi:hypothetical protein
MMTFFKCYMCLSFLGGIWLTFAALTAPTVSQDCPWAQ